ncbi:type III-B CRISPR module RAMP protein Cmr1 [Nocardia sp. NPDC004085]
MSDWIDLTLKVVTPMFIGDDPDSPATIRVPSIRGALRYWFRAVAADHGLTDPRQLWAHEEEIFGSARPGHPSKIALRIDTHPRSERADTWISKNNRRSGPNDRTGVINLLGQGLWDRNLGLLRSYIPPGQTIHLRIRLSGESHIDTRLAHAFWAWLTFGGLGYRTRRGFGRLTYQSCQPNTTFGWDDQHLAPPQGRDAWNALLQNPLPPDHEDFEDFAEWPEPANDRGDARPDFPALTPLWWRGKLFPPSKTPLTGWADALDHAGQQWRNFNLTKKQERGDNTPEWRNVIQGEDHRFPRGALGLPVGYHNKNTGFKTEVTVDTGRRASPIWMYPVDLNNGNGKSDWTILTHAFRCRLLPDNARVYATHNPDQDLEITDDMLDTALDGWFAPTIRARIPANYYQQS